MDFTRPLGNLDFMLEGLQLTILISALSIVIGSGIGLAVAFVRISRFRAAATIAAAYVAAMQSIPFIALLFWVYFVLPTVIGLQRPDIFLFGMSALGLMSGAYFGEVFRSGILAVPSGQRDAALSTGMTGPQTMRRVILPQAFRNVLPPFTSLCVSSVKDSAIVGPVLGIQEILWHANVVQGTTFRPTETFIIAACLYVAITYPLTLLGNFLHRRAWSMEHVRGPSALHVLADRLRRGGA